MTRRRFVPDNFTLAVFGAVVLASLQPCRGEAARVFDVITDAAIARIFFCTGRNFPASKLIGLALMPLLVALLLDSHSGGVFRQGVLDILLLLLMMNFHHCS